VSLTSWHGGVSPTLNSDINADPSKRGLDSGPLYSEASGSACHQRGVVSWDGIATKGLGCAISIALFALALAAPALAAPEWGITMEHHNAYGAQRAECPGGHESLPGEPFCGVDPYTGSGTTFDKESGFNSYVIHVANTAPRVGATETLTCEAGQWGGEPTFSYQWLRNGAVIGGATTNTYATVSADEDKVVQCLVAGTNAGGTVSVASLPGTLVPPLSATAPPSPLEGRPFVEVEDEKEPKVGNTLACEQFSDAWNGKPTFSYQWLRNGAPVLGATAATYTLTTPDEGRVLQCLVTATNAGGSTVSASSGRAVVPELSTEAPFGEPSVQVAVTDSTSGPVSVADELPSGLTLAGKTEEEASGSGWNCAITNPSSVTCTRSDALAPGESYPPITLHVHVSGEAPIGTPPSGGVTNIVAVYGGGASPASASASDATTISLVPFGIESFTTNVLESAGNPLTQAGGHPFAANATFVFNYVPDDHGELRTAGGSPKDIETELPPGFIGNTQTTPKCPAVAFETPETETPCPIDTAVGFLDLTYTGGHIIDGRPQPFGVTEPRTLGVLPIYNLVPSPGQAAAFGFIGGKSFAHYTLNARVRSDSDYGVTISSPYTATPTVLGVSLTFCQNGLTQSGSPLFPTFSCAPVTTGAPPFLTIPSKCSGSAPVTTLSADSYEDPSGYASMSSYAGAPSGSPSFVGLPRTSGTPNPTASFVTGCDAPELATTFGLSSLGMVSDTTQADAPTGAGFTLEIPQTTDAGKLATPELKSATVTLPEGMTVDPSAADGLQACTDEQFGLGATTEPAEPANCPMASQVGTVVIKTPLLEKSLEGQVFVGEPECSPCSTTDAETGRILRLFLQVYSPERGVVVKLAGRVSANPATGRLQATFTEQPQLPFSELELKIKGGSRAPLATPQACGEAKTTSVLTPWSSEPGSKETEGTPNTNVSSSFSVDWDGYGGACSSSVPFAPSFQAQTLSSSAGAYTPFTIRFTREDREQNPSQISVTTPPGLLGMISMVSRCAEPQAALGSCPEASRIGTTTVGVGAGSPFYLSGPVFLTGPYRGAPFGLSIAVPAVAGPFNLGTVVVRAAINVNPSTAAITVSTDPLPQIVAGVPVRLREVRVTIDRGEFIFNPTNCSAQSVAASITGEHINNGEANKTSAASSGFAAGGCSSLPFAPSFSASTQGVTSKANGASLDVKVGQKPGEANIQKVDVQLPTVLPSRLATLQKACPETQFAANPAGCPAASDDGTATATTPVLNVPLTGPAYLVSHGTAAFPDLDIVLQGEGVTVVLVGATQIKKGITFSRFETVPDAPISSFQLNLPEGPHSILAAPRGVCGQRLLMPTTITAQNGKQTTQSTKITITGCVARKPLTRAQKLVRARTECRKKKNRHKRALCEHQARKRYGPIEKSKRASRRGKP
jgi:hypothetical protein